MIDFIFTWKNSKQHQGRNEKLAINNSCTLASRLCLFVSAVGNKSCNFNEKHCILALLNTQAAVDMFSSYWNLINAKLKYVCYWAIYVLGGQSRLLPS